MTHLFQVMTLINHLGLSLCYDEMMQINTRLAQRVIQEAVESRVPVGQSIKLGIILHGAMDNFDHDAETLSGNDGSHYTILVLFQNTESKIDASSVKITAASARYHGIKVLLKVRRS